MVRDDSSPCSESLTMTQLAVSKGLVYAASKQWWPGVRLRLKLLG